MRKHIFISHSAKDKELVEKIRVHLETNGLSCWIAPRDIRPGCSWSDAIVEGIEACKIMVVVLSRSSDASGHVRREAELCVSRGKSILTFAIESFKLSASMEYCVSHNHWLNATSRPLSQHLDPLVKAARSMIDSGGSSRTSRIVPLKKNSPTRPEPQGNGKLIAGAIGLFAIFVLWIVFGRDWKPPVVPRKQEQPPLKPNLVQENAKPPRDPEPIDPRSQAILRKLEYPISMVFPNDTPFEDIIKYIQASTQDEAAGLPTGIPIHIDPIGLQDVDRTMASTVVINLEGVPLKATLQVVLDQLDMTFVVKDGFLKIIAKPLDSVPLFK